MTARYQPRRQRLTAQRPIVTLVLAALAALTLGILTVVAIFANQSSLAAATPLIRSITCLSDDGQPCPPELLRRLTALTGTPLLFTPLRTQLDSITAPAGYQLTTYQRRLPDTILVTVQPQVIQSIIIDAQNQPLFARTPDGRSVAAVQTFGSTEKQPLVARLAAAMSGITAETAPKWLEASIDSLAVVSQEDRLKISNAEYRSPFDLVLSIDSAPYQFRLNPQEMNLNLSRLRFILKSDVAASVASAGGELDLRFRVPVLRSLP